MNDNKCAHNVPIYKTCTACEKEMNLDFVVHNLGKFTTEKATQCIRRPYPSVLAVSIGIILIIVFAILTHLVR